MSNAKMLTHHLFLFYNVESMKPSDCKKIDGQLANQSTGDSGTWTDSRMKDGQRTEMNYQGGWNDSLRGGWRSN